MGIKPLPIWSAELNPIFWAHRKPKLSGSFGARIKPHPVISNTSSTVKISSIAIVRAYQLRICSAT